MVCCEARDETRGLDLEERMEKRRSAVSQSQGTLSLR